MFRFFFLNLSKIVFFALVGFGVFASTFAQSTNNHFQSEQEKKSLNDKKWRGLNIIQPEDYSTIIDDLEKKWNEVRPFFQEFKRDYPDLFLYKVILNGTKVVKVNLLVKYSEEKDISSWTDEALFQLFQLNNNKKAKKNLDDALTKAKGDAKKIKRDYFDAVSDPEFKEVVDKIVNSQHPYITVGDGHFRISEMAKFRTSAFNETKAEEEVIPFLLAKINSNQLEGALKRIPERISKWKEFQEWLKDEKVVPWRHFYNGVFFEIWALAEEKRVVDYYQLKGGARVQLDKLVVGKVNIADFIEDISDYPKDENNEKNKNDNLYLAIGLGGGMVFMTGLGIFFYWILRRR